MRSKINIILRSVFLLLIIAQTNFSQSGWVKQNSGTTENLNTVYFININNGFIVGDNGTLLRTIDGGQNWELQTSGTTNNLSRLSFIDSQTGFIWGSNRTFLKTNDGGNTWLNLSDSLVNGLIPSAILDENYAISTIAKNDTIKFYITSNGGLTWELFSELVTYYTSTGRTYFLDINNIIFIYSIAQSSFVQTSSDGGTTWKTSVILGGQADGGFVDASFIDSNSGWMIDFSGRLSQYYSHIYKTSNSGKSWFKLSTNLPQSKSIFMLDSNNGFVVGNTIAYLGGAKRNAIYKTTNGGADWVQQTLSSKYRFNSVFFSNTEIGTIVGDGGLILRTTTGGVKEEPSKWEIQTSGVTANLRSVVFTEGEVGYCAGDKILKTTNSGIEWELVTLDWGIYGISFKDSLNGFMVGKQNYVFRTSDGGNNWETIRFIDELWINALGVSYLDPLHIIVIGEDGKIRSTSDGGVSWSKTESGTYEHLNDISFVNSTLGFIAGNNGTILRSNDKGVTWESLESNTSNSLNSICFISDKVGFATGNSGTILHTSDSGESWLLQNSETINELNSVFFRDKKNGLIAGELGIILRTTDGGMNWTAEESGVNNSLYGVAIKDSVELVVGDGGKVLRNIVEYEPEETPIPLSYILSQNFPNPFNPSTTIEYSIPKQSHVSLKVYDLLGREITTLINEEKPAGNYSVNFDGSGLTSGVYFYRLSTGEFNETKKLLLLR